MKITIVFTNEELKNSIDLTKNITGLDQDVPIKDEHIVGSFGEMKFDSSKNEITLDIKTAFMNAYSSMIQIILNTIKQLLSTYEMFALSWFNDIRVIEKEEAEEPETVCE